MDNRIIIRMDNKECFNLSPHELIIHLLNFNGFSKCVKDGVVISVEVKGQFHSAFAKETVNYKDDENDNV